ncbi:hypothetical protein D9757_012333 [Collybiopsis confluens]|uniref:Chromatin elongation factor SPT5 n=1 Tax=Collybiopsis confluens TaxID=2823264 RepID=A0A8H5LLB3_9AGAR|nr:hypothetical protein D9757_012333 [Collybiopsis confluens]
MVIGHAVLNTKDDTIILDDVCQGVALMKLAGTERVKTFEVPHRERRSRNVGFQDGTSTIVIGSDHGNIYAFDRRTGEIIDKIYIGVRDWVQSISVWQKVVAAPVGRDTARREGGHWLLLIVLSFVLVFENILNPSAGRVKTQAFGTRTRYNRYLVNGNERTHGGGQFIDLEAQIDSSDEDGTDDESEARQGNEKFINRAEDTLEASSSTSNACIPDKSERLDLLVEQIEARYVQHGADRRHIHADDGDKEGRNEEDRARAPLGQLLLRESDWLLWRVKCTPGKEYFIIYELMMRHETLSNELRSAFFNPRDVGYIYLEANFTKSNISSLREVLREFSDLRLRSLGIVAEVDLKRCLVFGTDPKQVFAPGQWVSIKRGLYRGDVGLVIADLCEPDSTTGVQVMVVPRLDHIDEVITSAAPSKRKRRHRPSARLFNPTECVQEELVAHERRHVFSYKSWRFEYGLQLKSYNERSLVPAREVPSSVGSLFLEAKRQGADIEMESRPTSSLWRFETGEPVFSILTGQYGSVISAFDPVNSPSPQVLVAFENEGTIMVDVTSLLKDVILGQYVEVVAGVHSGRKGFVVAKTHGLLGICFNTNSLDVRLHANSVKLSTPDFLGTEIPWLGVPVRLLSGPFTGSAGVVKDVEVTSARSLAIMVRLNNGPECTVGYHAVRELLSGKLLLDHQPLKRHQQQFDVEAPWKEIRVTILSGRFAGHFADVKNAWIDFRGTLRLSLWVVAYNCSIEIDYFAVHEQITGTPLHEFRPLEGNQLKEFRISPSIESMRTGSVPWLGLLVDIVKGHYKGQTGIVKDVNRYKVNSAFKSKSKSSGLKLTIERHVYTVDTSTILVELDYDDLRFHNTKHRLCEVLMPSVKQSFYWPDPAYQHKLDTSSRSVIVAEDADEGSKTPLPNYFERETIFCGLWSPNCPTPGRSSPIPSDGFRTPAHSIPTLAPPLPPPPPPSDHWILHPKLVGIPIKVDISSGELETSKKKDGIVVETISGANETKVVCRRSPTKVVEVPYKLIRSFHERPNPAREKALMVVARNHTEHIGKLVRRIHHFYDMEKTEDKHWLVVQTVNRSSLQENSVPEFLDFHPGDLEYVKETPEERKQSTLLLQSIRLEFSHNPVEIRLKPSLTLPLLALDVLRFPKSLTAPSELLGQDNPQSPDTTSMSLSSPSSPLSKITRQMANMRLGSPMPGSFVFDEADEAGYTADTSNTMETLETLLTAAVLTNSPVDESHNDRHKLFSSAAECYEDSGAKLPLLLSLDLSTAVRSIASVVGPSSTRKTPSVPPACQAGGRRFASKSVPSFSPNALLPDPTPRSAGKVEREEAGALDRLLAEHEAHYADVFDGRFTDLSDEIKRQKLDKVTKWLNDGLAAVEMYEDRMRFRMSKTKKTSLKDDTAKEKRDLLRERMRALNAQVCVLYAPLIPESPIEVDAAFTRLNPLNQVLTLLGIICHLIIGLSIDQSNFIMHSAILCAYLGMSTGDSHISSLDTPFSPSQNALISEMPKNLPDALKRIDVDGHFDFYATCPSCSFSNKALPLKGKKTFYAYPETCKNDVVGENGVFRCSANLLKTRRDGTAQPIKPYLVSSLSEYLARCLADATFVEQSKAATDSAFHAINSGKADSDTRNVFEAKFIKDFRGPDGTLFVDRGDKIRLAFAMHVDFFNPNRVTQRGASESLGVISCANLALDPSIRYRPEFMYMTVIPGPNEPSYDELDHYIRPVIEQFVLTWRPGLKISRTADSKTGAVVEASVLISLNDLPAARKVAGLQGPNSSFICSVCDIYGKDHIFSTDYDHWTRKDTKELQKWAWAYKNAKTLGERKQIFSTYGVRWSSFWLLEYWDPTTMLVIDAMHCILEGLVHYHCRHVLRLDASAPKLTSDGLKIVFDRSWIPYSSDAAEPSSLLAEKHIPAVAKIQETLCLSLSGQNSLSLDKVWTRLNNCSNKGALGFVVRTLELLPQMVNINETLCSLYVARAKANSKRKDKNQIDFSFPHGQLATTKHHLITLLLNWRLQQPHCSDAYIIPTGTPETLAYVQKVIRETIKPAYINSVPKNFGEPKAGSLKADEWRTLSTLYLPIALVTLWGDNDGIPPPADMSEAGHLLQALNHTMALFQATTIACRYVMTANRARAYQDYIKTWTRGLQELFPHVRGSTPRPNIHAAAHIYDFLMLFGPVVSWWCFPYERLIGVLQKVNTNNHIGAPVKIGLNTFLGEMEATIVKTMARTANIRRWLRHPDCPDAIHLLKALFDKCFVPVNDADTADKFLERKGEHRAYVAYDGGNSTIIYRPSASEAPVAGQIQFIKNIHNCDGQNIGVQLHVRPHNPMPKALHDPFLQFPYFNAKTYSSTLRESEDIIELNDVVAHAARFDYSYGRSVLSNGVGVDKSFDAARRALTVGND